MGCPNPLVHRLPARHPLGIRWVVFEPAFHLSEPFRRQLAGSVGMELDFAGIRFARHCRTLRRRSPCFPSTRSARRALARERRDMTVPNGTPSIAATSAYEK